MNMGDQERNRRLMTESTAK